MSFVRTLAPEQGISYYILLFQRSCQYIHVYMLHLHLRSAIKELQNWQHTRLVPMDPISDVRGGGRWHKTYLSEVAKLLDAGPVTWLV